MNDNDVEEQLPYLLFRRSLSIFLTLRNVLCKVRMVAAGICHLWLPCHLFSTDSIPGTWNILSLFQKPVQ
jgi:hypothetical protein